MSSVFFNFFYFFLELLLSCYFLIKSIKSRDQYFLFVLFLYLYYTKLISDCQVLFLKFFLSCYQVVIYLLFDYIVAHRIYKRVTKRLQDIKKIVTEKLQIIKFLTSSKFVRGDVNFLINKTKHSIFNGYKCFYDVKVLTIDF